MTNIWTKFSALLPSNKQLIGTIISNDLSRFTCSVRLISGDIITVSGNGDADTMYLIINNELSKPMDVNISTRIYPDEIIY